jgi:hypothetical protein
VPKSLRADRGGIAWPTAPLLAAPDGDDDVTLGSHGGHGGHGGHGQEAAAQAGEEEVPPALGTVPREAAVNLSFAVGHMLEPKASVSVELLGGAGNAPGRFQPTPQEAAEEVK